MLSLTTTYPFNKSISQGTDLNDSTFIFSTLKSLGGKCDEKGICYLRNSSSEVVSLYLKGLHCSAVYKMQMSPGTSSSDDIFIHCFFLKTVIYDGLSFICLSVSIVFILCMTTVKEAIKSIDNVTKA